MYKALLFIVMMASLFVNADEDIKTEIPVQDLFELEKIVKPYATVYISEKFGDKKKSVLAKIETYMLQVRKGVSYKPTKAEVGFDLSEVYKVMGVDFTEKQKQADQQLLKNFGLSSFITLPKGSDFPIYILESEELKNIVKQGHYLPNIEYIEELDKCSYSRHIEGSANNKQHLNELILPYYLDKSNEGIDWLLKGLVFMSEGRSRSFGALHQLIESLILQKFRSQSPHVRWFTAGFSSALAEHFAAKYGLDGDIISKVIKDPSKFSEEIRKEINLRYWPSPNYAYSGEGVALPTGNEGEINNARHGMSMYEAKRFLEKCGLEKFPILMNAIVQEKEITGDTIVMAMLEHCYYDMDGRLDLYQSSTSLRNLMAKYEAQLNSEDKVAAAQARIRLNEIRLTIGYYIDDYVKAAKAIAKAGFVEDAVAILKNQEDQLSNEANPDKMKQFYGHMMEIAWQNNKLFLLKDHIRQYGVFYSGYIQTRALMCYLLIEQGFYQSAYYTLEEIRALSKVDTPNSNTEKVIVDIATKIKKAFPQYIELPKIPTLKLDMSNFKEVYQSRLGANDPHAAEVLALFEKDPYKQFQFLKKAAESSCPDAQVNLAKLYAKGVGTEVNWEEAISLAKSASIYRYAGGAYYILAEAALRKENGQAEAYRYLTEGIKKARSPICYSRRAGLRHEMGDKNFIEDFRHAASYGDSEALFYTFQYYAKSMGPQSYKWLKWSAERGYKPAQEMIQKLSQR